MLLFLTGPKAGDRFGGRGGGCGSDNPLPHWLKKSAPLNDATYFPLAKNFY